MKMVRKKRGIALLLSLCIAVTAGLSGCGAKKEAAETIQQETQEVNVRSLTEAEKSLIMIQDLVAEDLEKKEAQRLLYVQNSSMREAATGMLSLAVSDFKVKVKATSVEKDLRIQFVDNDGALVKNRAFEITVTDPKKNEKKYSDEDRDGKIYLDDLEAGTYKIVMSEMKGLTVTTEPLTVKVKDKVDYKKIEGIENEILKDSQVSPGEDKGNAGSVDTGSMLTDTVEWVESTKTLLEGSEGDTYEKVEVRDPYAISKAIKMANQRFLRATSEGEPVEEASLLLDKSSMELKAGSMDTLNAAVKPEDYQNNITWESKDSEIAKVDEMGNVVAVKEGSTEITARVTVESKELKAVCKVKVTAADVTVTSIVLDPEELSLEIGAAKALTATVLPTNAIDKTVTFTSSDEGIASVDEGGKVTALAAGKATITARAGDKKAACKVTVKEPPQTTVEVTEVRLNVSTLALAVGASSNLNATVLPTNATDKSVTFSSDKEEVAKVDSKGKVTGVSEGTATVTVTAGEKKAVCKVTVKKGNASVNGSDPLKDVNGNPVYVKSGDTYKAVTNAEYQSGVTYYKKVSSSEGKYKYTGWQTLDGKVYFFDKNGNKVTGEQVIQGIKYNFASDGSLQQNSGINGIDVSKFNGSIDWNAVRNAGISWVIVRVGYRGSSVGALVEDPKFRTNAAGAAAAGLKVGIYFYTQAVNEVEAVEEASMTISLIKNYKISYPVFIDTEKSGGRGDSISAAQRTAVVKAFCETIRSAGYTPGVYASKSWFETNLNVSQLNSYKIWLAHYTSATNYKGRYDLWQYSDKGRVSGISTNVDMNISYLGY